MPDQMPFDFALGADWFEFRNLEGGLLDAAFAERVDSSFNSFADANCRDGLADGDQRDFGSLATGALARRRYTPIDRFQPRLQSSSTLLKNVWSSAFRRQLSNAPKLIAFDPRRLKAELQTRCFN